MKDFRVKRQGPWIKSFASVVFFGQKCIFLFRVYLNGSRSLSFFEMCPILSIIRDLNIVKLATAPAPQSQLGFYIITMMTILWWDHKMGRICCVVQKQLRIRICGRNWNFPIIQKTILIWGRIRWQQSGMRMGLGNKNNPKYKKIKNSENLLSGFVIIFDFVAGMQKGWSHDGTPNFVQFIDNRVVGGSTPDRRGMIPRILGAMKVSPRLGPGSFGDLENPTIAFSTAPKLFEQRVTMTPLS